MEVDADELVPETIASICAIPDTLTRLLLSPYASIRELLAFDTLPVLDRTGSSFLGSFRFSRIQPHRDIRELRSRTVPPIHHLLALRRRLPVELENGHQCFLDWRYNNSPTPFFMLEYWVHQSQTSAARLRWSKAEEWLLTLCCSSNHAVARAAEKALSTFSELEWDTRLLGTRSMPNLGSAELQPLLQHGMLLSNILDAMISGIHSQYMHSPQLTSANELRSLPIGHSHERVELRDLTTFCALRDLIKVSDSYWTNKAFRSIRQLGAAIANRLIDVVYLPLNVNGNHWTLFTIDVNHLHIRYGDSLGGRPAASDIQVMLFWLSQHGLCNWDTTGFLPIAQQPADDTFSCGLIVINAIRHGIFGEPLWSRESRDTLRIAEYMRLVQDHLLAQVRICTVLHED